jgi:hypothetical protein
MDADDASSAEMKRLFANPELDPLALDEDTAERLLDGDLPPAQAPPGYERVAALLAATAAAPSAEELAGKAAAMAELQSVTRARLAATPRRAGRPPRRRRVGLAVAVVVGALSTGGIAVATTGNLPDPIRDAARSIRTMVGGAAPAAPAEGDRQPIASTSNTGPVGGATGGQGAGTGAAGPGTTIATAAKDGLCRAYAAGKGVDKGKKLDAAVFKALAEAAGGADNIAAFCQGTQPGETTGQDKKAQPGNPGQGQDEPPPGDGGGNPGHGGGPPASTGGTNAGEPGPPDTRPNDG